jgi:predicted nucleic acid-binding protein
MTSAVDSSVLLDIFNSDATFGLRSKEAVRSSLAVGRLTACEVVWAEVASLFPSDTAAETAMQTLGVEFDPIALRTALLASTAWKGYRARGGKRQRVVADFLIGAHALAQADRLLTRDRGFYRICFSRLTVMDPSA